VAELDAPVQMSVAGDLELVSTPIPLPDLRSLLGDVGVPDAGVLTQVDQIAVFGGLCVEGEVARVPGKSVAADPPNEVFRCTHNTGSSFKDLLGFTLSVEVDLGRPGDTNHSPDFDCDPRADAGACHDGVPVDGGATVPGPIVLIGPEPAQAGATREVLLWRQSKGDDSELPWEHCAKQGFQQVHAGDDEHQIQVRFDPFDREVYTYQHEQFGKLVTTKTREELIVSHALTEYGGKLDREKSVLSPDAGSAQAEIEVAYTPPGPGDPGDIPADGRLVRFFFAVRDQRTGLAFTTRDLCLLPARK
jgi:hypothetical protein